VSTHIVRYKDLKRFYLNKNVFKNKVYRHGDRTPAFSYPTSTADESSWPNGFGQLTPRGRIQQIRLGKYIRERYSQLLNSTYVASEVSPIIK